MEKSENYESKLINEQNKNIDTFEIPKFVIDGVKNLILNDKHNLFQIKAKEEIQNKLSQVEINISDLLKMKNVALEKEKKLEEILNNVKKINSQLKLTLKKSIGI